MSVVNKCETCGEIVECEYVNDPYNFKIVGDTEKYFLCKNCLEESENMAQEALNKK